MASRSERVAAREASYKKAVDEGFVDPKTGGATERGVARGQRMSYDKAVKSEPRFRAALSKAMKGGIESEVRSASEALHHVTRSKTELGNLLKSRGGEFANGILSVAGLNKEINPRDYEEGAREIAKRFARPTRTPRK